MDEPVKIERRGKYNKKYGLYICSEHGEYWQNVVDHNRGHGCKKCGRIKANKVRDYSRNTESTSKTKRSRRVVPAWVLDMLLYDEDREKFKVGDYEILENYWFVCPSCGTPSLRRPGNVWKCSTGEKKFDSICCSSIKTRRSEGERQVESWCISQGWRLGPRRGILTYQRELDIYLPDQHVAIEYDGECFHQEGDWTRDEYIIEQRKLRKLGKVHTAMMLPKWRNYHKEKNEDCANLGIKLIHIKDDEWWVDPEGCKCRILEAIDSKL